MRLLILLEILLVASISSPLTEKNGTETNILESILELDTEAQVKELLLENESLLKRIHELEQGPILQFFNRNQGKIFCVVVGTFIILSIIIYASVNAMKKRYQREANEDVQIDSRWILKLRDISGLTSALVALSVGALTASLGGHAIARFILLACVVPQMVAVGCESYLIWHADVPLCSGQGKYHKNFVILAIITPAMTFYSLLWPLFFANCKVAVEIAGYWSAYLSPISFAFTYTWRIRTEEEKKERTEAEEQDEDDDVNAGSDLVEVPPSANETPAVHEHESEALLPTDGTENIELDIVP